MFLVIYFQLNSQCIMVGGDGHTTCNIKAAHTTRYKHRQYIRIPLPRNCVPFPSERNILDFK